MPKLKIVGGRRLSGEIVVDFEYDRANIPYELPLQLKKDDTWYIFDKNGEIITSIDCEYINNYSDELALVIGKNQAESYYMDKSGKKVIAHAS